MDFICILKVITGFHGQNQSDTRTNQKDGRSKPEPLAYIKGVVRGRKERKTYIKQCLAVEFGVLHFQYKKNNFQDWATGKVLVVYFLLATGHRPSATSSLFSWEDNYACVLPFPTEWSEHTIAI